MRCECGVCQLFEKLSGVQSSTRARPPRARPADLPTFGGVEIGGLVFAAVCVVLVAAVPALVARRSAITQSRELDRFSPGLRMIRAPEDKNEPRGRATGPLLAPSKETGRGGGTMERTGAAPRSTERVSPRAVRDIARLRAKRAARLASEAAASKRRMAASAVFALATVLLGVGVWAADLAWVWTAIPGAALVASLGASRFAAVRSQREGEREVELLRELRGGAPRASSPSAEAEGASSGSAFARSLRRASSSAGAPRASGNGERRGSSAPGAPRVGAQHASGARAESESPRARDAAPPSYPPASGRSSTRPSLADEAPAGSDAAAAAGIGAAVDAGSDAAVPGGSDAVVPAARTGAAPGLVFNTDVDDAEVVPVSEEETARAARSLAQSRTWTVVPVPAPTYVMRGRISGRMVHADTDLRGIPKVAASVPARPVAATYEGGKRSTEEVVADQAVALNLEAVLDSKRAQ